MNETESREKAWVGDAVLALFAREWILQDEKEGVWQTRSETFKQMTSNSFLACMGEPTKVEARIGEIYQEEGLQAAFGYIETHILPTYQKQRANRLRGKRSMK